MKKEEMMARFKAIGGLESAEEMRTEMVKFQEEMEQDYDLHESTVSENVGLKQKNQQLKDANMELYLKVTNKEPVKTEQQDKKEFKDLFNEKGGLK